MKRIRLHSFFLTACTAFYLFVAVSGAALAQGVPPAGGCDGFNPDDPYGLDCGAYSGLTSRDPRLITARIINVSLSLLGILATALMVFAGFKWMTAGGNEEQAKSARQILVAAVIGLAVILSAYSISYFVLFKLESVTR